MGGGVRDLGVGLVLVGLLSAACTAGSSPLTTVSAPVSTVVEATTTTTAAFVSTSTTAPLVTTTSVVVERLSDPLSIAYPVDPVTVDDLPVVLTGLIGAPMPEPNLLLDSEADFGRWLDEWINWYTWLSANPTVDPEVLAVGFVPETDEFERQLEINRTQIEAGRRTLGWWVNVDLVRDHPADSAMFEQRVGGFVAFDGSQPYPRYAIGRDGEVIGGFDRPEQVTVAFSVRNGEEVGWRIEYLDVF